MQLKDRVAIVTGSSQGIGREIALRFAREGARVVVNGRDVTKAEGVVKEIGKEGGIACAIPADVRRSDEVTRLIDLTVEWFAGIDILVNNAGGSYGAPRFLMELTEAQWHNVIALNLTAAFYCCKAAVPHMLRKGKGVIINVASQAGRSSSELSGPAYASAKAGLIGLTRQLAMELGPRGIRVNAIAPGVCLGPGSQAQWEARSEEDRRAMLARIPLGQLSTEEEQANVVAFLASDESSYIHGAVIDVNGGRFML